MKKVIEILLIEDSAWDADLIQRELKRSELNFNLSLVQSRETCENALMNKQFDIILSDNSLPSFDGIGALKMKQEICPDVPLIIVSGSIGEEKAVELLKSGVSDYVLKDNLISLSYKINRALDDAEMLNQKKITDKKLKLQTQKLYEIAFLQSHQVRSPISNILGLISLINFETPDHTTNNEALQRIKIAAEQLDHITRDIIIQTSDIQNTFDQNRQI